MNTVILIVVVATSVWVLNDAKSLGVRKGLSPGFADLGPWGWFFACLFLWIVTFPLYLSKRLEFKRLGAGDLSRRPSAPSSKTNVSLLIICGLAVIVFIPVCSILVLGSRSDEPRTPQAAKVRVKTQEETALDLRYQARRAAQQAAIATNATSAGKGGPAAQLPSEPAAPDMPKDEQAVCAILDSFANQYAALEAEGANQLKLSKLKTQRNRLLGSALASGRMSGWTGTVHQLMTNTDGNAALDLKLPCQGIIKTWNNGISDTFDRTLIQQRTKLFDAIAELKEGQVVKFSATLIRDDGAFREASVTERGGMKEPELIARFTTVSPL